MKVAKIQDLENLADGTIIGEMVVQVKAAFDAKTGQGKYGPWRVQPCILKDATGEVRASFWTQDDMKELTGQTITIKSQAGAKGLVGLKVKQSSHSGKNELDVSDKAAIIDGTRNAVESYTDAVKVNTQLAQSKGSITDAKRLIFQRAQLYAQCVDAVNWIAKEKEIGDFSFQEIVATLFISADKAGLSACFPVESVKPVKPQRVSSDDDIPMDFEEADRAVAKKPVKDELLEEAGW